MDRRFAALLLLVFLAAVFVSGCTETRDMAEEAVMVSTGEWLGTEQGTASFPEGIAGEPVRVWKDGETLYWIATIENGEGLYIGNLIVTEENFTSPQQIVVYKQPRGRILNCTREEAYQQMIMESGYPAYQISKPILVAIEGKGLSWYSEVRVNNEVVDELYIETFTLF